MLDFTKLKKMYPKAVKEFVHWNNRNIAKDEKLKYILEKDKIIITDGVLEYRSEFCFRDLFDFFDHYKIIIEVYKQHSVGKNDIVTKWSFDCNYIISTGYFTRKDAESSAFKIGFKMLNKKL